MRKSILFLTFSALYIIFTSCSSVRLPDCFGKNSKDQYIRWGEFSTTSSMITFYELKTDKTISLAIQEDKTSIPKYSKIGKISDETYCKLYNQAKKNIMGMQVLNSPGAKSNFFELNDSGNNFQFRAVWNPQFDNKANHNFKILFDDLQQAVIEASK